MDCVLQTLRLIICVLFLSLPAALVRAAGDNSMYTVHGVAVDVTAENAAAARERAVAIGARNGLEQLLKNLTADDQAKSLPPVTEKLAMPLIQDFEVENERGSGVRYVATLTFRFRPDGVRALLHQQGGKTVDSRAPLMLVIPVYRAATGDMLWEDGNPWRSAWKGAAQQAALVPVVVPEGSAEDRQIFGAGDLGNPEKLQALAQKYKASGGVLVIAQAVAANGDPAQGMTIALSQGGTANSFNSDGAADVGQTLNNAVRAILDHLDGLWRRQVLQGPNGAVVFKPVPGATSDSAPVTGNPYTVEIALRSVGDWAALRTRLSQVTGIRTELKSMSRARAVVALTFTGSEDQLRQALQAGGINLGTPTAVPADDDLSMYIPATGPGAGLLYTVTTGESP